MSAWSWVHRVDPNGSTQFAGAIVARLWLGLPWLDLFTLNFPKSEACSCYKSSLVSDTTSAPEIHLNSQLPMGVQLGLCIVLKWPAPTPRTTGHQYSWWVVADYLLDVPARHFPASGQEMVFKMEILLLDTDTLADTVS